MKITCVLGLFNSINFCQLPNGTSKWQALWHLVAFYVSDVLILPPCLHEEFLPSSDWGVGGLFLTSVMKGHGVFPLHASSQQAPSKWRVWEQGFTNVGSAESVLREGEIWGPDGLVFVSTHFEPSLFCLGYACVLYRIKLTPDITNRTSELLFSQHNYNPGTGTSFRKGQIDTIG